MWLLCDWVFQDPPFPTCSLIPVRELPWFLQDERGSLLLFVQDHIWLPFLSVFVQFFRFLDNNLEASVSTPTESLNAPES